VIEDELAYFIYFNSRYISVHHLEEMSEVEDVVELALAADEFLLETLTDVACLMLERMVTVENVWHILNATCCYIPKIAAVCSKVIYFIFYDYM